MTRRLLGLLLCAALASPPAAANAAQPTATAAPAPARTYRSYLASTERTNLMFQGGLDADDAIGAQVLGPAGETVGTITDLLVEEEGRVGRAILDVGALVGAGSKPVVIELARLRRAGGDLALDIDEGQLAALPEYRQGRAALGPRSLRPPTGAETPWGDGASRLLALEAVARWACPLGVEGSQAPGHRTMSVPHSGLGYLAPIQAYEQMARAA